MTELPTALRNHFATSATIDLPGLARLLPMDVKTLHRHIAAGRLSFRIKGTGAKKKRRVFLEDDVAAFLAALSGTPPVPIRLPPPPPPPKVLNFPQSPSGMRMTIRKRRRKS